MIDTSKHQKTESHRTVVNEDKSGKDAQVEEEKYHGGDDIKYYNQGKKNYDNFNKGDRPYYNKGRVRGIDILT